MSANSADSSSGSSNRSSVTSDRTRNEINPGPLLSSMSTSPPTSSASSVGARRFGRVGYESSVYGARLPEHGLRTSISPGQQQAMSLSASDYSAMSFNDSSLPGARPKSKFTGANSSPKSNSKVKSKRERIEKEADDVELSADGGVEGEDDGIDADDAASSGDDDHHFRERERRFLKQHAPANESAALLSLPSSKQRQALKKSLRIIVIGQLPHSPTETAEGQTTNETAGTDKEKDLDSFVGKHSGKDKASALSVNEARGSVRVFYSVDDLLSSGLTGDYDREPIWISIEDASHREYSIIGKHFGLHPLTIEDCQSPGTREKFEIFQNYLFLIFHSLHHKYDDVGEGEVFPSTAIRLIVFPSVVISFHRSNLHTIWHVRDTLDKLYSNRLQSTSWMIHAILDCIVDGLLPIVDGTSYEVDALDDLIYVLSPHEHRDLLKRMGLTRRRLLFLRQRLWSKRDILLSLIGKDWQHFLTGTGVQIPYMRDIYDHLVTMLHKVEAAFDLLGGLQNTYLAIVSIDVSEASNSANRVMKQLSAVATIILPLSLFSGLMGMNVQVPFQHDATQETALDNLGPFIGISSVMLMIALALFYYFKRRDLL